MATLSEQGSHALWRNMVESLSRLDERLASRKQTVQEGRHGVWRGSLAERPILADLRARGE